MSVSGERGIRLARAGAVLAIMACAACDSGPVEVSDPFYLWHLEDPDASALLRCVEVSSSACAIDDLPDPPVLAAGANTRFVVLRKPEGYFYFRRIAEERRGWGANPEVIIGPLSKEQFANAQSEFGLPDPNITP